MIAAIEEPQVGVTRIMSRPLPNTVLWIREILASEGPLTAKEIAAKVRMLPASVYVHMVQMDKDQMIKPIEELSNRRGRTTLRWALSCHPSRYYRKR